MNNIAQFPLNGISLNAKKFRFSTPNGFKRQLDLIFHSMRMVHSVLDVYSDALVSASDMSGKLHLFSAALAEKPTSTEIVSESVDQFERRYALSNIIFASSP